LKVQYNALLSNFGFKFSLRLYNAVGGICTNSSYTAMYGTISEWNTEDITDMSKAFNGQVQFNGDINSWQGRNISHIDTVIALIDTCHLRPTRVSLEIPSTAPSFSGDFGVILPMQHNLSWV
jgi:hypothetical protein